MHKIIGAAAEAGASLDELKALGEKVIASVKTLGVALSPCTLDIPALSSVTTKSN
ncbi:dihydroxyacetone-binding subunit dhaK [Listeria monocytogenes N53-1]|nr:dihydroxyacetone-binding subunit dhaK [Listeria monocytogenes]CCQ25392.1 dihydroxyacetone-binding subunit dhaK [Listeria monocytogenes N53-1]